MATHRDSGPAEAGASGYPGQPYRSVDYPTAGPGYSGGREGDRRYAERIPRYPENAPDGDRSDAGTGEDRSDDLRLGHEDLPAHQTSPAPARPEPSRPSADPPTATYRPTTPVPPRQPGPEHVGPPVPAQHAPQQGSTPPGAPAAQQPAAPHAPAPPGTGTQHATSTQHGGAGQQVPAPQQYPYQQGPPADPPQPESANLSDLLHEPTQLTEQVPAYPAPSGGGTVHRSHAQLAWLLGALATLLDIPVVVVLVRSLASDSVVVSGVLASLLLLPGLPMLAAGAYQLFAGRITVRPGDGLTALLRRPFGYLLIGIVLVVAAGLAAS